VPFLGGANITDFIVKTAKAISLDDPRLSALQVRAGWILVTRSGTTGIVSTVPEAWDGFAISEHVIRIVPDPRKAHPGFLFALLSSDYGQEYLRRGVFGSVIDEISPEYVGQIPIPSSLDKELRFTIGDKLADAERMRTAAMKIFGESVRLIDHALQSTTTG
jgi:restriction endonuclease S subunit